MTNLAPDHLIQGSMDPMGIADFFRAVPNVVVTHLPSLHAKVYVADESVAIITSANLTHGGIVANYEYGVWIEDAEVIRQITQDLKAYAALGSNVTLLELEELATASRELQQYQKRVLETARDNLREEFQRRIQATHEALRRIRAKPGESTNSIFTRTILFLLKRGPLTTQQLHPLVQQIHPDLCDDNIDRVIGEVHFGKRWKHMVRNAQQALKSKGLICLRGGKWHIAA
ncbi:MAG: phospholipase D family protein [Chloroflexi bacterium]|nr:phospholipase D family protein [Chloroflexota bacterium]